MKCEIDAKNINYLISKIRDLELQVKLAKNAESAFYNMESKLQDENARLRENNENLEERIKELEEERDMYFQKHVEYAERIKELEEQLAHYYDSGLEAVHPYSNTDDPVYPDDPRDYPEEQYE